MGILAATIVNVNRDPKSSPVAKPTDFMPEFGPQDEPDPMRVMQKLALFTAKAGGTLGKGFDRGDDRKPGGEAHD